MDIEISLWNSDDINSGTAKAVLLKILRHNEFVKMYSIKYLEDHDFSQVLVYSSVCLVVRISEY